MIFPPHNYKKIMLIIGATLILVGGGIYLYTHFFSQKESYVRTPPILSRDVVGEAGNMVFTIKDVEVPLREGTATVEGIPGTIKMMSASLEIDFNKDSVMDRAVIIKNERDDGSMYFYVSVVIVGSDNTLSNTNTILLGEGTLIQRMIELPDNMFSVEYLDRKSPKDTPSLKKKRTFKVEGYNLTEIVKK